MAELGSKERRTLRKAARERARKTILRAASRHGIEVDEDSAVRTPGG